MDTHGPGGTDHVSANVLEMENGWVEEVPGGRRACVAGLGERTDPSDIPCPGFAAAKPYIVPSTDFVRVRSVEIGPPRRGENN